jgi:hypothetical protein
MEDKTMHIRKMYEKIQLMFCLAFCFFFIALSAASAAEKSLPACIEPLKKTPLPAYAANKLGSIEQDLAGFEKHSLTTNNEEETLHELVRILKSTKSKYEALNHYVFGWNTTIEYLYRANKETARRGVEVSRIFIVSDDVLGSSDKLQALIKVMDTQSKDGIKVSYGLRRDLEKDPTYHPFALMDVGLSDDAVFAKVTAVSLMGPQPAGLQITWDENVIKVQNPFPYLKKSQYIYEYDENAADKLLTLASKELKPVKTK